MRSPPFLLAALLAALSPCARAAPTAPAPDPLEPLRFLEGRPQPANPKGERHEAVFEVAEPGKDFAVYVRNRLVRRR